MPSVNLLLVWNFLVCAMLQVPEVYNRLISTGCSGDSWKAYGWRVPAAWEVAAEAGALKLLLECSQGNDLIHLSGCSQRCLVPWPGIRSVGKWEL